MSAALSAAGHDPGDEDQAERKPAYWWDLQRRARGREEPRTCAMCGGQPDHGGHEQSRAVGDEVVVVYVCGEPRCKRSLGAGIAAMRRRACLARIPAAFRRGIEAAQREQAGEG